MKKLLNVLLVAILVSASTTVASAQTKKIGIINMEKIVSLMPEKAKADTMVYEYQMELFKEYEAKQKVLQEKMSEFQKKVSDGTYSEAMKQLKANEIQEDEYRLQTFGSQIEEELLEKRNKLYAPLMEKIVSAAKEVCKEKGYSHVVDSSMFIYFDETDLLDDFIITKLKLTKPAGSK